MDWLFLILAGFFEVGWPVGMKWAQDGNHRVLGILFALLCLAASGALLWQAQKTIPMGTAYAVWTGIGAVGAFLVGIFFFGDPQSILRWAGAALIVGGVALLKAAA
jgi:quaternary ammonium compound-resistance protein SugE